MGVPTEEDDGLLQHSSFSPQLVVITAGSSGERQRILVWEKSVVMTIGWRIRLEIVSTFYIGKFIASSWSSSYLFS